MQAWRLALRNKKNTPYESRHGLLFNEKDVTLCVGVLSKQRYTDVGLNAPFETVVALLVRTRLKYQRHVRIDVLNVEESSGYVARQRDDLKDLVGLVNIVELR